jgi:hypothetical protein
MKNMYKIQMILAALMLFFSATAFSQQVITNWNFNDETLEPSTGEGTAVNIGDNTFTFASGAGNFGNPDRGWNTSNYPAQESGSGTAGVQFDVSTAGHENIVVNYFHRNSGTASRYVRFQYTANGSDWVTFDEFPNGPPHDTFYERTFDLSGIPALNDNPNFAFRIVSIFSPEPFVDPQEPFTSWGDDEAYRATRDDRNYASTGTWRFDDVAISGDVMTGGTAVSLAIISVNGGNPPAVNQPFNVVVQAQDNQGLPANVNQNTEIALSKETGTGILGGSLSETLINGFNTLTFEDITYNIAESGVSIKATATGGMSLAPAVSDPFSVLQGATQLAFVGVPASGVINHPIADFTVEARRPDNSVDETYTGTISVEVFDGPGNLSGTTAVEAVAGIAEFSGLSLDATGNYTLETTAAGLTSDISPVITIIGEPSVATVLLPQYISGNLPADNRIPFAFRATIGNLFPNATYKYINQAIVTGDSPTTNGAGNLLVAAQSGDFFRSSSPTFNTPEDHGEFVADASGNYTGWFMLETTGNARFTPGNYVFMRIRLNDGAGGTDPVSYLTLADSVNVLGFSQDGDPDYGTAVRAVSFAQSKNFAVLYDNVDGSGRPLFATSIETVGIDYAAISQYSQFYKDFVSGFDGAWGGILPNVNANGMKCIEERSLADGEIVATSTSETGIWGEANTVNPTGGLENVLVINLIEDPVIFVNPSSLSGFTYLVGEGPSASQSYNVSGQNIGGNGFIAVTAPASYEISLDDQTFTGQLQLEYDNGNIINQPVEVFVRLKAGLAAGVYNDEFITHTDPLIPQVNVELSGSVTEPVVPPAIAATIVPQFIQGINGTNVTRVPFAFWVSIADLQPNTTYRYINQVVNFNDSPTTNGAGNVIYVTESGDFYRSSNPDFNNPEDFGELTADNSGNFSGWFITEPTGNARFTPGSFVSMRIRLNDGMGGTSPEFYLTTSDSVKVINFDIASDELSGTAIRANTLFNPKNFTFLYDNTSGSGRPVYATSIEITGVDFQQITQYPTFYQNDVSGISGAWGGIVPNILPNGIQRVEERRLSDGAIQSTLTSETGIWYQTNTVNPTGGLDDALVLDLTTGINESESIADFRVFDFSGKIIIESTENKIFTIKVTNLLGQVIHTEHISGSTKYYLSKRFKTGIYLINISGDGVNFTGKLFIR